MTLQLSLFQTYEETLEADNRFLKTEMKRVAEKAEKTHVSADKVRKSLFARNNELQKKMMELEQRLEILERNICNG